MPKYEIATQENCIVERDDEYKGWTISVWPDDDSYLSRSEKRWRGEARKAGSVLQSASFGSAGREASIRMLHRMIDRKEGLKECQPEEIDNGNA